MDIESCTTQESVPNPNAQLSELDTIEPINRSTVHRICSGQVVLSLAIAVKELVENAIDAAATNIEVRMKDYGSELIEVSDNGGGVRKEHFQALTLKHYTSKLREFSDLESVGTLGFRGEALSSLCALSELTIITRHASAEHATKIQYDLGGKIVSELPAAREIGTTVTLTNLFATLPVRRKEFTKNLKREYNKMCQLLYAYCLVSKGIKFMCTNITKSGSRSTVVCTEGSNSIRENIISVFGARQIPSLIEVEMVEPEVQILEEYKVTTVHGKLFPFKFECTISSATHGSGRSTSDRQFFYINSRPCEPNKIMKLINEVYRQFNSNQYPFVFLNVIIERSLVDVNVTPDKRQIFLEKEKLLLAVLKSSLLEAFKNCPSTYKVQNLNITNNRSLNQVNTPKESRGIKRALDRSIKSKSEQNIVKEGNIIDLFRKSTKSDTSLVVTPQRNDSQPPVVRQTSLIGNENFNITVEEVSQNESLDKLVSIACKLQKSEEDKLLDECFVVDASQSLDKQPSIDDSVVIDSSQLVDEQPSIDELKDSTLENIKIEELNLLSQTSVLSQNVFSPPPNKKLCTEREEKMETEILDAVINTKLSAEVKEQAMEADDFSESISVNDETVDKPSKKTITVRSSMKYLQDALKSCQATNKENTVKVRFRSEITPAANKSAEQELQKQILKDTFKEMEIIGQFNLGFIIAKLENDLFIIDQHATDEKYNFEQLQLSTVLDSQVLVNPKPLELTAANEEMLIEHEEVFRKNGFSFRINREAPATKKVSLTSIPMSKNYIFGKDDIEEMLFMLQEDVNHTVCRPSRVRTMFASRACRKSVMVGSPLSQTDMRRLVDHMGEIDQPWNCPHGRPTMRHLINLKLLQNT